MGLPDGFYTYEELKAESKSDFKTEHQLCDYIEENIVEFTEDCLGYKLLSFEREFSLIKAPRRLKGIKRIDFLIKTQCGKAIGVECKNPLYINELSSAIGQCLGYYSFLEGLEIGFSKIVLVSSKIDFMAPILIKRFNLPIDFVVLERERHYYLNNQVISNGRG